MVNTQKMAQLPVDKDGRLYHMGLKQGELAARIITVGDACRAYVIAQHLDGAQVNPLNAVCLGPSVFVHTSSRGFTTYTGTYQGTPVSIVAIGMGYPMMDFFVRESRTIVTGPMAIIRFGSCGSLKPDEEVGSFCIADKSFLVTRNVDAVYDEHTDQPVYHVSKPCEPSSELTDALRQAMQEQDVPLHEGHNGTADSFYCSQGRIPFDIIDKNEGLLERLAKVYNIRTLDMETFYLFHLAQGTMQHPLSHIKTAAVKIIFANRTTDEMIISEVAKRQLEKLGGKFCLEALQRVALS